MINSIHQYRNVCRELYATLLTAAAATAELQHHKKGIRLKPRNDAAKIALAAAMGAARITKGEKVNGQGQTYHVQVGAAKLYELRDHVLRTLWPTALSFVWDSIRRSVTQCWGAPDPEHPEATQGYLALQGARGTARFQRVAIGFPLATARPKLAKHSITLKWDRDIGSVTFNVPRLDYGSYAVWRALRDGDVGWGMGTLYLTEKDGQIHVLLTHDRPARFFRDTHRCVGTRE